MSIGRLMGTISKNFELQLKHRLMDENLDEGFEQNHAYFQYLIVISAVEGITQNELAGHMTVNKGSASKAVRYLLNQGLIERIKDPEDNRVKRVYLTEDGEKIVAILKGVLVDLHQQMVTGLTQEEIHLLEGLLEKVCHNIIFDENNNFMQFTSFLES